MKNKILLVLLLATALAAKANPVDLRTAREVAVKFMNANAKVPLRGTEDLQLVTTYSTESNVAAFHIFNTPNGFVIVSADDCATPILGYSDEGRLFDPNNVPIQMQEYLQGFVEQIQYGIENRIVADENTARQWELVRSTGRLNNNRDGDAVEPLITTQWDQGYPYNALCPDGYPTGCTATATAQIMNFWQYPAKGVGYNSYTPRSGVGMQSAWFNETCYQWDVMDIYHEDAISTLVYHVGVSMNMDYNSGGSSASLNFAKNGLLQYFDYSDAAEYTIRGTVSDDEWIALLKNDLSSGKPVLYEGYWAGRTVGHAWVVDGYDSNGLFHMNFGWSGNNDGYYSLDGQPNGFNYEQGAVFGVQPANSSLTADFRHLTTSAVMEYQFVDFSKGDAVTYHWYFGDGETSTMQNPVHHYAEEGSYQVTLVVTNNSEITNEVTKTVEVIRVPFLVSDNNIAPNDPMGSVPMVFDYDMDGHMDAFVTGYLGQQLYHNEDTVFRRMPLELSENGNFDSHDFISVVDFEKDNHPSLICSGNDGFFLYNDNGNLDRQGSKWLDYLNGFKPFTIGDYNGDGVDDVLLEGILYKNIGNGALSQVSSQVLNANKFADYDGDGDLDLIGTTIYRNDGNDLFTPVWQINTVDWNVSGVGIADMNGDTYQDFLSDCIIHYNHENDTLNSVYFYDIYQWMSEFLIAADFNSDGTNDIFINQRQGPILLENYIDTMISKQVLLPKYYLSTVGCSMIDVDNNNIPDVIIAGPCNYSDNDDWAGFGGALLMNSCTVTNNPPSAPQNLWANTEGNSVVLHWDTVSDDHSRYGSITYNLMVGTTPDGFDVKSPLSNIETGQRYASNKGNAGFAPLWKLNNLPNGTYYWRVQAIDNSLAASQFSEMGAFVINGNNLLPEISCFTITTTLNRDKHFNRQDFKNHYFDKEGDTLQGVQITQLPLHGSLLLDNTSIELNQQIGINDVERLCYRTSVFENDTLFFKAYDQNGVLSGDAPVCVDVLLFENTFMWNDVWGDVAWGDYDNDGHMDFASTTGVYHNTGDGFEKLTDSVPSSGKVLWADINNDGFLDGLFDNYILFNNSEGHFVWSNSIMPAESYLPLDMTGTAVGDINNDNNIDYYLSGTENDWETGWNSVFYNVNGGLTSESVVSLSPKYRLGDASFGDINHDGKQDIVTMGYSVDDYKQKTNIYINNDGNFTPILSDIVDVSNGSVDWGDYDNDGDLDLLICGIWGDNTWEITLKVYENLGNNEFAEITFSHGLYQLLLQGRAVWMDFDNDSYLDILASGYGFSDYLWSGNPCTRLFRNINGSYFEEVENNGIPNLSYSRFDVADYDGDGFEDVIISGFDKNNISYTSVFSNGYGNGHLLDNQQSAPTRLEAIVQGSSVFLSWNDTTTASYNLYIKDSGGYIVSPMADIATGFRKVTDYGNAGHLKNYTLRGLPAGTYQWSVQTIDKAYQGSLFATEMSFDIICNYADTTMVYDTTCYVYENDFYTYNSSGIYYEYYLGVEGCDSVVERHVTIIDECTPVIYVRTDGDNDKSGFSWTRALSDLQLAMNKASKIGGQVWVAEGTYYGDGVSENAFIIPRNIAVYGGFAGNEPKDYDLSLRDFAAHPTILDGQHTQRTVMHNWTWMGTDNITSIDGFTIQNGYTKYEFHGANIYGDYDLLVDNCIIRNGEAIEEAGGVACATVKNSLIYDNIGHNWAGGVAWVTATNCILVNNVANVSEAVYSTFTNCILWHTCGYDLSATNVFTYSAIQDWTEGGEGNISLAHNNDGNLPDSLYVRFVDPENGDFRLACSSVCINMGTPDIGELGLPLVDLAGNPRVLDGRIDIGAYEFDPSLYINHTIVASVYPEGTGSITGEGEYMCGQMCILTASPNEGYAFVNWTKDGEEVGTSTTYSFTVTEAGTYVANFEEANVDITQSTHFNNGWTWWSTCIEQPESNGLTQLENGLGNNGLIIKKQTASLTNVGGDWYGTLYALDNASSYRIKTNAEVDVDITGPAVATASHPVTLLPNWTWIGYPCAAAMSIDDALAGITPTDMDVLKTQSGSATYMFGGWYGALGTLTPGMGLMYKSNSSENITLTFPSGGAKGELRPNLTAENNHWQPNLSAYPDNMTVIAVVEIDEEPKVPEPVEGPTQELGENYELAAFANGECRGSVRLLYVEPIQRYIAFLTLFGDEDAELHFGLYDTETGEEYHNATETLTYESNAVVGSLDAPYVIRFRGNTGLDDLNNRIEVFPNPVERGQTFNIGMTDAEIGEAQVDVINALGIVVETCHGASLQAPNVPGVYTLRIIVEGKGICYRKLVVE